jgi:hypothetical protein
MILANEKGMVLGTNTDVSSGEWFGFWWVGCLTRDRDRKWRILFPVKKWSDTPENSFRTFRIYFRTPQEINLCVCWWFSSFIPGSDLMKLGMTSPN